jgi:hypothetical protein
MLDLIVSAADIGSAYVSGIRKFLTDLFNVCAAGFFIGTWGSTGNEL